MMKIAFISAHNILAQQAFTELSKTYGQHSVKEADCIVALGGDGHVMKTVYDNMGNDKPVYGMRRTESVGFLCNDFMPEKLTERLKLAQKVILHPLVVQTTTVEGKEHTAHAINEVTILRETPQSARLNIFVDEVERISKYSGDGILLATPAGSTAYNHSCGGPIMPIDANTLVMTAISGYRPRGWRNAILPQNCIVEIRALETGKRPVRVEAGGEVIHNIASAKIWLDMQKNLTLLFDPDQHLGERIVREQFML